MHQIFERAAVSGLTALALLAIPLSSGVAQDATPMKESPPRSAN